MISALEDWQAEAEVGLQLPVFNLFPLQRLQPLDLEFHFDSLFMFSLHLSSSGLRPGCVWLSNDTLHLPGVGPHPPSFRLLYIQGAFLLSYKLPKLPVE